MRRARGGFADVIAVVGPMAVCLIHAVGGCPRVLPVHAAQPAPIYAVERELRLASAREGVPYALVRSIAVAESSLVSTARSSAGAIGVMQLEPSVASDCHIENRYDVHQNVVCGVRLLRTLLVRYAWDVRRAVEAYNVGPAALDAEHPTRGEPRETKAYAERVLAAALGR